MTSTGSYAIICTSLQTDDHASISGTMLFLMSNQHCQSTEGTPSKTWFPGPTWVLNPNRISIGSAILQGSRVWQTGQT